MQDILTNSQSPNMKLFSQYLADVSNGFCSKSDYSVLKECQLGNRYNVTNRIQTTVSAMSATFSRMHADLKQDLTSLDREWLQETVLFGIQVDWLCLALANIHERFLLHAELETSYWRHQADGIAAALIVLVILIGSIGTWIVSSKVKNLVWVSKGLLNLIPTAVIQHNADLKDAITGQRGLEILK